MVLFDSQTPPHTGCFYVVSGALGDKFVMETKTKQCGLFRRWHQRYPNPSLRLSSQKSLTPDGSSTGSKGG